MEDEESKGIHLERKKDSKFFWLAICLVVEY